MKEKYTKRRLGHCVALQEAVTVSLGNADRHSIVNRYQGDRTVSPEQIVKDGNRLYEIRRAGADPHI